MGDLRFYQLVIEHLCDFDRRNSYDSGSHEKSFIGKLIKLCQTLATDELLSKEAEQLVYKENFYSEYQSIVDRIESKKYSKPKYPSNLFSNVGWRRGSCDGKKQHLPLLLAWYYWKTETLLSVSTAGESALLKVQSGRDFHEEIKTHAVYRNADGKQIRFGSNFRTIPAESSFEESAENPSKPPIKRDWIDPYNTDAIPFVGRERELEQLDEFAGDGNGGDFKVWVMVAPSGAGKTRLTYEWVRRPEIADDWQVLYLGLRVSESSPGRKRQLRFHTPDRTPVSLSGISEDGETWTDWRPDRPNIFVIDYVFGFGGVINGIMQRCKAQNLAHPVRLLVLDHKFPDELDQFKNDARWSPLWADGERMAEVKSTFHNNGEPLDLSISQGGQTKAPYNKLPTEKLLRAIAKSTVERPIEKHEKKDALRLQADKATLDQAMKYLKKQPSAQYPLFAALVGNAIRYGKDYAQWNRRDLTQYYLSGHARLPWENEAIDEEASFWASSLICAATALRGLPLSQLRRWTQKGNSSSLNDLRPVLSICERVISKRIEIDVPPFEPDFVGETFFLLYIERILNRPNELSSI